MLTEETCDWKLFPTSTAIQVVSVLFNQCHETLHQNHETCCSGLYDLRPSADDNISFIGGEKSYWVQKKKECPIRSSPFIDSAIRSVCMCVQVLRRKYP